jgi:hypothetical protein
LIAPVSKSLKLKYDKLLSNVAFKINLRRYNLVVFPHGLEKEESDPETYPGEIESSALVEWLNEAIPDFVMPLKAKLVDNFLQQSAMKPKCVLFYAKAGRCRLTLSDLR